MTTIPDQRKLWDRKHGEDQHENLRGNPTPLAQLVEKKLPEHGSILELGCGVGRDAIFFAQRGHDVVATDFSTVVINKNKALVNDSNPNFIVMNMEQPLPYPDNSFDLVHANLSLHYYDTPTTRVIFKEIHRVLRPGGLFSFLCKSTGDFHYGKGKEVGLDYFVSPKGHVRHLFSLNYSKELLTDLFETLTLEELHEEYSGRVSAVIRCIAKRRA